MKFSKSNELRHRFNHVIPGGAHTYAKGDDQFPEGLAPYIVRGQGCRIWDRDGNRLLEFGMGLRSVTLGHAFDPVVKAAQAAFSQGNNFGRPSVLELECAEELLAMIPAAEMVKFGKNGSDANNAAIKLARAYTQRDHVVICRNHPFYSVDDWFIGSTPMSAGIPEDIQNLTLKFTYNDIGSLETLFQEHPDQIACVVLEPEKEEPPGPGFLQQVQAICRQHGSVLILDENITGFRWHNAGAQAYHGLEPDLSTFGKAMANGFSMSALVGKRALMELGGLQHERERVFLLSLTHGAESGSLAAGLETMRIYQREPVIEHLWAQGERLARAVNRSIEEHGLQDYVAILGKPCCLVYATRDQDKAPSQAFRTLFLQETIRRGLMAPSLVVSYSHQDSDIDEAADIIHQALSVYRKAIDEGIDKYLDSRPVKPVWRRFN